MAELRTLVVGGLYTEFDGAPFVPERCWRMVSIFADVLARPVFARRRVASDDRRYFSTPFPHPERLFASNARARRWPWELVAPDLAWERARYDRLLADVDAVYCRLPSSSWAGMHLYDRALAAGKIVFASFHGDWPATYRQVAAKAPWPLRSVYRRDAGIARRAFERVAATARVLFCVGDDLAHQYGAHARASVTFANYLHGESDLFPREDTCREPPYRIVYVGELSLRKGVTHLVDAAARLRAEGVPVSLSLVGRGEERERLVEQAQAAGLGEHLTLHGYVPFGPEIFELYRASDLFVLPSLAGEGAPKVVVEAMSQGLPVVATRVGSTGVILEKSGGGLAVPAGDGAALARALRRIIEDAGLRRGLIRSGLDFARRMTNEHQRRVVAEALERHVPELVAG